MFHFLCKFKTSSFYQKMEYLNLFFQEKKNTKVSTRCLNYYIYITEFKNLHFLVLYPQNTKQQKSHRITWERVRVEFQWKMLLSTLLYELWKVCDDNKISAEFSAFVFENVSLRINALCGGSIVKFFDSEVWFINRFCQVLNSVQWWVAFLLHPLLTEYWILISSPKIP